MTCALVVTCEHASAETPAWFDPGVPEEARRSHHAWDPGAGDLARGLAQRFGAPLHLGGVTRLFVDLNRAEENPQVIPLRSFDLEVRGNHGLTPGTREERLAVVHRPYRARVREDVLAALGVGREARCVHLSCHSFTPVLGERRREVELGVLFDPARPLEVRVADLLLAPLRAAGWDARANEPYLGVDDGLTTWLRPQTPPDRYAGIEVEVSQGIVADPARFARACADVLAATAAALEALRAG